VQIVFTPDDQPALPKNVYRATERGFTLEFVIDPGQPLDPAINAILAGDPLLEARGIFGLDLSDAASLNARRESGAPLDSWLSFDAATLSFAGVPPSRYVGAVPVRIDVAAGNGRPAMAVITEAVVDRTFTVEDGNGLGVADLPERIDVTTPRDFNGSVAFTYTANDEKGAVSAEPAIIVFNVNPTREKPFANRDDVALFENGLVTVAITSLIDNDRDDDGDTLRVTAIGASAHGSVQVDLASVSFAAPVGLVPVPGGSWSATLADGTALPGWMAVDAATGAIRATVPLATLDDLAVRFVTSDGTTGRSATQTLHLDGNAGATLTYRPDPSYAGTDTLAYTLSDGREGSVQGMLGLEVQSLLDPPVAVTDRLSVAEDGVLLVDPALLLVNDYDVDGDPFRFAGVRDAVNGIVSFDGATIRFTPTPNYEGPASFLYVVADEVQGPSLGRADVTVISTNHRPTATTDVFATVEDVPFEFTIADLLRNDVDSDGDAISFVSIQSSIDDARVIELPNGRYQFVPNENIGGPRSFSYAISDGRLTGHGTVTFDISGVNDAPIANPDGPFFGDQDTPLVIRFADMLFNDRDVESDAFRIVEVFDGDNGTVTQMGDTAVFLGRRGYFGDGGFHYRTTDALGATSTGYVSVLIFPQFDVPIPVSDAGFEMLEDSYIDIDPATLLANDDIPLGSTVTFLGLTGSGVTALANGSYRVTPDADFFGPLVLRYSLTNETGFAVPTTVTIQVLPVSDAPVAVADMLETGEDEAITIFTTALTDNDFDVDRQGIQLTRILGVQGLTARLIGNGQIVVTPTADFHGVAGFDYELKDSGGIATVGHVSVTVASRNDAPAIGDLPLMIGAEDQPFRVTLPAALVSDVDGDVTLVEVRGTSGAALPAWLSYDRATRTLSGQPPADVNGSVSLEIAAFDGTIEVVRPVTVTITPVNDAPTLQSDGPLTLARDDRLVIEPASLLANDSDIDGDALLVLTAESAAHGSLVRDSAGRFVYTPVDGYVGADSFRYTVSDGALSREATVQLQVTDPFAGWRQGTAGGDVISGFTLADNAIYGASGDDRLTGGMRNDRLEGGRGNDVLNGLSGDDRLGGGDGNDSLSGGAGNDRLSGGRGDDLLSGGWGNDVFVFNRGDGNDVVADFTPSGSSGMDRLELHIPGVPGFTDVMQYAYQTAAGVLFDFGQGDSLLIRGATLPSVQQDWFTFS